MAEELLNNSERLPSADIFSLGVSIYEMCCFTFEEDILLHYPSNNQNDHVIQNDHRHHHRHHHHQHLSDDTAHNPPSMFFTIHRGLPSEGPSWHTLRENRAPRIPTYYSKILSDVVISMMEANYNNRPSASEFLSIDEIIRAESYEDVSLKNVPRPIDNRLNRSISFYPDQLQINTISGDDGNNGIDYIALGDRAFTPHFNNPCDERSLTPLG